MIPIKQKNLHNPQQGIVGDCYRACICSLLEISDEGVENFVENPDYPMNVVNFLKDKGFRIRHDTQPPKDIEFYIANGISPRGVRHSVIHSNGQLAHDPHPSNAGNIPDLYLWLEKRD